MSAGQYALGVLLLCVIAAALAVTVSLVRRMLLPAWSRAPARLAEAVIGVVTLVLVSELLGTVGAFSRYPFVVACVAVAGSAILIFHRRSGARNAGPPSAVPGSEPAALSPGRAPTAGAILVVFVVLIPWMDHTLTALHAGMREYDTLSYHLQFAARFAQDASITGLQYVGNAPVSFYPLNSELIHAIGILVFHRDILSPVLNVGWFGFALLAAWCIGRPAGVGPATMAATALALSLPVIVSSQAGTAKNDVAALALLLAAVALLINGRGSRAALALAVLSAGLAVGMRLNLWASVIPLAAVVIVAASKGSRSRTALWWMLGIVVGGGFWYARNLALTGNPLPWFGLKIAGLLTLPSTTAPLDCGRTTVAHYLSDPTFVKAHLVPGLVMSVGARWWIVLFLAAAGVGAGLLSGGTRTGRALALVALVSGVAYVLTPATAGGAQAHCFAFNTRFAMPALAIGLIVLPLVLARRGIHPLVAILAIAAAVVFDTQAPFKVAPLLATIVVVAGVSAVALRVWRALPRAALASGLPLIGLLAVAGGWHEQRIYFKDRYSHPTLAEPVEAIYRVLAHVSDARVAVTGFFENYPLYGVNLTNRIELPAARMGSARFAPYSTCRSWLIALERGRYDYVVTASQSVTESPAAGWTRRYPGARQILASRPGTTRQGTPWRWELFRLTPHARVAPPSACGDSRLARRQPRG